jgi:flavin reductase (DIM6/NTAB) family NADH-FMN oxidoreductase RutF
MKKSFGSKPLVYPAPVWVLGTYDKDGKPNVMTFSWGGICCSKPPCVSVSVRPATYTYGNLIERKAFTINIPSEKYAREADYFGMVSGKTIDKFSVTGLTPLRSELVDAPYVKEFPMVVECKVIKVVEIGLHTQFIGEIIDVKADDSVIGEKDLPDLAKVSPIVFCPERRTYWKIGDPLGEAFSIGRSFNDVK